MRLTERAKIHFTFVSKPSMDIPGLMVRSHSFRNAVLIIMSCLHKMQLFTVITQDEICSFRNLSMVARINLLMFLALEMLQWMFLSSRWDTSKVVINPATKGF